MTHYNLVSIPGSGVLRDGTPMPHYANRILKGVEILKDGETDSLIFLGPSAGSAAKYAKERLTFPLRDKIRWFAKGYGTLQEAKYLKEDFVKYRKEIKNMAAVTQNWHKKRTEMIYRNFFPEKKGYSVEVIGVEDGRSDKNEIAWDIAREKVATELDSIRLALGPVGKSDAFQSLVELNESLYNRVFRKV